MKFKFILARRKPDAPSQIILDVSRILLRRGHEVESCIPEEKLTSLDAILESDVYLLKSYTELSLSLAGALSARRARLINPYEGCAAARNKIVCYGVLREAGVPVPRAWITADMDFLRELLLQHPLILKPHMGWRGEGVQVVRSERELASYAAPETPMLIQEYVPNGGEDLRVYVAGEQAFGVRKSFSPTSFSVDGEPVPLSPEIRDIALSCGRAFGLRLYGVDIIEGPDGPKVVDVNYFPGYKGVPGAADAVANCIEQYAGALALATPLPGETMNVAEVAQ
jgi:ribosomal protein S6--L-glutamate ligase